MPDSADGLRPISQTPCPLRFAAKCSFLAAYERCPNDAEMQHNRPSDVERRQQNCQAQRWHALTLGEGRGVFRINTTPFEDSGRATQKSRRPQLVNCPSTCAGTVSAVRAHGVHGVACPMHACRTFATHFSSSFCFKTFGVAKLVVTIQIEHDAHLCSLQNAVTDNFSRDAKSHPTHEGH